VWTDVDPDRTGLLPFVFEEGFGFERWVDYALDVPMYFLWRDNRFINAAGQSFRDFLAGRLPALPGEKPTMSDFADHLTTIFPEARIKRFLEVRGADGGPWGRICALPALWVGLLYDGDALQEATERVAHWDIGELNHLRIATARHGLKAEDSGGSPILPIARDIVAIAKGGLTRRGARGRVSSDETEYLEPLEAVVDRGESPAETLLKRWREEWNGNFAPLFEALAY
jgi:glutamate--cysteine ligase